MEVRSQSALPFFLVPPRDRTQAGLQAARQSPLPTESSHRFILAAAVTGTSWSRAPQVLLLENIAIPFFNSILLSG